MAFFMYRLSAALATLLLVILPAPAQLRNVDFDMLSIQDGLSQGTVFCILQDHEGFMWFGTADGLNKYDGYTFTHYSHDVNDSTSLSDNRVIALLEDHTHRLWIGTIGGGLNLLDRESGTFRRYRARKGDSLALSDDRVNSLFEDRHGTLWVGTTVAGLNAFDPETGTFRHYRHQPLDSTSLSSDHVFPILEDRKGNLWIGTPAGLNRFDRETGVFHRIRHIPDDSSSLSHNYINVLFVDSRGTLWVGTVNGLNRLDDYPAFQADERGGSDLRPEDPSPRFIRLYHDPLDSTTLSSSAIWAIHEDATGTLWIGTDGGGLNRLNRAGGTFDRFRNDRTDPKSLSDNSVRSIHRDRSGTLWVGTNTGGLSTWNPRRRKFATYTMRWDSTRSVSANWIHALHEDPYGRVWIGSASPKLDILDRSTGTYDHLGFDGPVEALAEDRSGRWMWVGSRTGLSRIDYTTLQRTAIGFTSPDPDTLAARRVRVLESDRAGNIWIGYFQRGIAVYRPDDGSIHRYTHDPADSRSLSDNLVRAIHQDHDGALWIGTYGGLDRFAGMERGFDHFRHDPANPRSLSNNNILSLYDSPADSGAVLWVGTFGGGLNRLDVRTGRVTRYTTHEGLPNNVVYGILGDEKGRLWLTTNRGMAQLDIRTGAVRVFDVADGLQGNEFSTGAYHAGRSGIMYVGGVNGFSCFHPDSIAESTFVPPVLITAVHVLDRVITPLRSSIRLGPGDKFLTFEFAVLDYANPLRNQYAYRLLGFDDAWHVAGSQRRATFTNLDPGEYTFEVKGSNSDGVWNAAPVALHVTVVPPFWKTWWFRTGAAAALLLIGSVVYRRRLAAHVEKARILEELQAARSLQLGLLPAVDPTVDCVDVSGICLPAMEVGGDFFDYLGIDPGHTRLTLALGDVSGKGLDAAMTAVMALGMLHRETEIAMTPAAMLRHMNSTLYLKTDKRRFVAMLLATVDSASRALTFANAGLSLPLRKRGDELTRLTGKGERFPLGVRDHSAYEDCVVDLRTGDLLVFTTDGVAEARGPDGTFFDDAGVERVVRELPQGLCARDIVQHIITALQTFVGDAGLNDDLTVVVLNVL